MESVVGEDARIVGKVVETEEKNHQPKDDGSNLENMGQIAFSL